MKITMMSILCLVAAGVAALGQAVDDTQSSAALNLVKMAAEKWNAAKSMTFRLDAIGSGALSAARTVRVAFLDETLLPARVEFFSRGAGRPTLRIDCDEYSTDIDLIDETFHVDVPAGTIMVAVDEVGSDGIECVPVIRRPPLPLSDGSDFETIPRGVTPRGETVELEFGDEKKEVNRGKMEVVLHGDGSFQVLTDLTDIGPPSVQRGIDSLREALKQARENSYWESDSASATDVVVYAPADLPIFLLQKFLQIASEEGLCFYRFHIAVRDRETDAEGALPCFIVREWDEIDYLKERGDKVSGIYSVHFFGDPGERFVYELEMLIGPVDSALTGGTFKSLRALDRRLDDLLATEPKTALIFVLGGAFIGGDSIPESPTSLQELVDLLTSLSRRGADLKRGR